jgi:hypothetical protein
VEHRLFSAAAAAMVTANPRERWRPTEILDALAEQVAAGARETDLSEVIKTFEVARGILRQDRDFKPFTPGKGISVGKALLMVLMRPIPSNLLSWTRDESGADPEVMMTAAVLCGLLNGHKRLATEFRTEPLDRVLARRTAAIASPWLKQPAVQLDIRESAEGELIELLADGEVAIRLKKSPPTVEEVLAGLDLTNDVTASLGLMIAVKLGWDDAVNSVVSVPSGSFRLVRDKKGVSLECAGTVSVTQTVDAVAFRRRLKEGIPDELAREVSNSLAALPTGRKVTP